MPEPPPSQYMLRFARFGARVIWSLDPGGFYEDPGFEGAEFANEEALLALSRTRDPKSTWNRWHGWQRRPPAPTWDDLVLGGSAFGEFLANGGFSSWEVAEEWLLCA